MTKRWRDSLHLPATLLLLSVCALPEIASAQSPAPGNASTQAAAPAAELAASLSVFNQLGLPSSKGAKWVRASVMSNSQRGRSRNGLPSGSGRTQYSGDAWLLREQKDGTAELLIDQCQRITVQLMKEDARRAFKPNAAVPMAMIQAADLDADIKLLAEALGGKTADSSREFEIEQLVNSSGTALLFIAHLQQQGHQRDVANLLPKLLNQLPSATAAIDAAISDLADAQLDGLAQAWIKSGDTKAYLAGIKKLQDTFTRGWRNFDAATLLSERLEKSAATVTAPEALKAAAFLSSLKDLTKVARGRNWLHPGRPESEDADDSEPDASAEDAENAPKPPSAPTNKEHGFLQDNPRQAALGLALLLGDRRLLRLANTDSSSHFSSSSDDSAEEKIAAAYKSLPRPMEMGEAARQLLGAVVPQGLRDDDESKDAAVIEWLREITALNDEQLGWEFLRQATSGHGSEMANSLAYLVESGSDDTIRRLREVFLDPALWKDRDMREMIPPLSAYIKRAGADPTLEAKIKAAIQNSSREMDEGMFGNSSPADVKRYKEQMAKAAAEQMKLLEQALHPRGLKEMLADLAASKDLETASSLLALVAPELAGNPAAAMKLYPVAAKLEDLRSKTAVLDTIITPQPLDATRGRSARPRQSPPQSAPPQLFDAETKQALATLLADKRPIGPSSYNIFSADGSVADLTAAAVFFSRKDLSEAFDLTTLNFFDNQLFKKIIMAQAQALANDQKPPALPTAASVPAPQVAAILAELSALPPAKILETLRTKTESEQLALYTHLKTLKPWPAALQATRLTVGSISGGKNKWPAADAWQGRVMNAELKAEIEAALASAASPKTVINVQAAANGLLGGLTLRCSVGGQNAGAEEPDDDSMRGPQSMPLEHIKRFTGTDIPANPPPVAVIFSSDNPEVPGLGRQKPRAIPIWTDPAKTKDWQEKQAKAAKTKKPATPPPAADSPTDEPNEIRWMLFPVAPASPQSSIPGIDPPEPSEP